MKNVRNIFVHTFMFYTALCFCLSCERSAKTESPVIARVGRSVLTLNDLNKSIPSEYSNRITRKQRINYVKQWIDTELLYQEALRQKIDKEKEICKRLGQMKRDLLSAEMISRNSSGIHKQKISEESINDYYEQHKESFIRESDVVKYIEILIESVKTGWQVRNMITPTNFLELAAQYSLIPIQDPQAAPFIPLKNLPPEISDVVFNIRLNGTTSPIKMPDGVHIIRVLDKQKAGEICLLEEVREEIISTLSAQSQKKDIENLLAGLRQKSDYKFHFELITQGPKDSADDTVSITNETDTVNTENKKVTSEQ